MEGLKVSHRLHSQYKLQIQTQQTLQNESNDIDEFHLQFSLNKDATQLWPGMNIHPHHGYNQTTIIITLLFQIR